jgi:3-deoxy-7-phosphoheptulonate synthase/chorismate mutase
MSEARLAALRQRIDALNEDLLRLLQERARVVLEIAAVKQSHGLDGYDPKREEEMLHRLVAEAEGPFEAADVREIFKTIFRVSLEIQDRDRRQKLHVKRRDLLPAGGVRVGSTLIGAGPPVLIAGPCSVESAEQIDRIAAALAKLPAVKLLRGGAFKPRTNPYSFQGLREEGLKLLHAAARKHGLPSVTEVLDTATLGVVAEYSDMLQVGARNMYNTELLKAIGRTRRPVLLKRGFMSTLDELLMAAEYILAEGNHDVVLCERGIRTFERWTRNTLDISAVPLLKQETSLPVIVDLSHALGRSDILLPCARAALAAGADGLMIEVHDRPDQALSDGFQQVDLEAFATFVRELGV